MNTTTTQTIKQQSTAKENTMNTTHNNTHMIPTFGNARGTLYYTIGTNGRIYSKDGWFHRHHMNNELIIGRNFRGRRAMQLTNVNCVVDFVPTENVNK